MAQVQVPNLQDKEAFIPTYETRLLSVLDDETGMKGECTCLRHKQGILCDHLYAHIQEAGGYNVTEFVHERDTQKFYAKQYPVFGPRSLSFKLPSYANIHAQEGIFLPPATCARRGRPKKGRFISDREKIRVFVEKVRETSKRKAVKRRC